ncbi:MAG: DUF1592 domain-containing protein [Gemmataceae bacterium]
MKPRQLLWGLTVFAAALLPWEAAPGSDAPPAAKSPPAASFAKDVVPFLTKHCYACHGNGKKRADLALDKFTDDESILKDRKLWDTVLQMVRSGEMPPKEKPRPSAAEVEAVMRSLDAVLASFDCSGPRNVGRVTLRRLNKVEYNNTIRDLVGVDFKPAADFPNDDVGYGFDNIGDVLSLSPLLLERYLSAADSILEQAIVIADPPKPAKIRLASLRAPMGVGEAVAGAGGTFMLWDQGDVSGESYLEEGDYIVRAEVYGYQVGDQPVKAALRVGRTDVVKSFEVKAERAAPAVIEGKTRIRVGTARVGVSFLNPYTDPKEPNEDKKYRMLYVRNISVEGPFNPPPPQLPASHKQLMAYPPGLAPREAARAIIERFATRAFRRPVPSAEVDNVLKMYDRAEAEGERFENRVRLALNRVLVSPHFLFRVELDPADAKPGTAYALGEYELASRLSYFLWNTMPDDELFALAAKGQLRPNLDAQIKRMIRDPKSASFVLNFAGQWLALRKLDIAAPDPKTFPNFDADLRAAMIRETELFFEAVVREDRSILDFLDANYSFVNERLAKHYGIEGVKGKEFTRVALPPNRGGILTQASILTLTSNATRTSPVKRGKWVLDQVLNTPPPPPPPDVPEIADEKQLTGSLRQVLEKHRENATCASCHNKMDPIGFAFENYDATGAWRDRDGSFPIDPTGVLPDGQAFRGPAELKALLRTKKEQFARCLAEKLLTYALGRGLEYYDKCAVDKIVAALDKNDYKFSTLLVEVAKSEPFLMRTATGSKP